MVGIFFVRDCNLFTIISMLLCKNKFGYVIYTFYICIVKLINTKKNTWNKYQN